MPFEVIKTAQQIEKRPKTSTNLVSAIRQTVAQNGVQGLYVGLPVVMLQSGGKVAIRFGVFSQAKAHFPSHRKFQRNYILSSLYSISRWSSCRISGSCLLDNSMRED